MRTETKELSEKERGVDQLSEAMVAISTLERYTGSSADEFQPYILLTNFKKYVDMFSRTCDHQMRQGSAMRVCHSDEEKISVIDYGVGSPVAALIVELLSFIKPEAVLMLGMCGGLRDRYEVGDFFNPIAAIREEGTSNAYMPPQCPSLSSFVIQRFVSEELDGKGLTYHTGVIHTTNVRFWEFNEEFKVMLKSERVQAIDMECATLFTVGYARHVPVGALMLISDLPLRAGGVKTNESAKAVFSEYTNLHIDVGISVLKDIQKNKRGNLGYQY